MTCQHTYTGEKWEILDVRGFWCLAQRGHGKELTRQNYPCDVMMPLPPRKHRNSRIVRMARAIKREATAPDEVAAALLRATSLDLLWQIAGELGVPNDPSTRASKSHLNPGLQRMWVGNQARKLRNA